MKVRTEGRTEGKKERKKEGRRRRRYGIGKRRKIDTFFLKKTGVV